MENYHDIDKKFNEASQSLEEPAAFPGFDKVWDTIEEKLDKKEEKKRILPVWFPYGIAAGLAIGSGVFYFMNKKEIRESSKSIVTKNVSSPKTTVNQNIATIDSTIQSNIKNKIQTEIQPVLAYEEHIINDPEYLAPPLPDAISPSSDIEDVVVTAYGIKRSEKSTASASMSVVSSESISKESSRVSTLSGRTAGVEVSSGSRKDMKIAIRGLSSISNSISEQPLIVVDGLVSNKEALNILNPKHIKEMNVVEGSYATALYGSRAKNGVIIIQTRRLSKSEKKKLKEISLKKAEELIEEPAEMEKELPKAGLLTAGEVNDFSKWDYWKDIAAPTLDQYKNTWKFFPDRRVSVQLVNKNRKPVIGEKVKLLNDRKEVIWEAVSDNLGNAELWINPMTDEISTSAKFYLSDNSGQIISTNIREFKNGQNLVMLDKSCLEKRTLDIAFVVDATGSMGDEISYLQSELLDVLKKVESQLKNTDIHYGSVFYRDQGDEYVTRKFDFSDKAENLINFIKKQNAGGGGDTPEAVVEAMQVSIDELKWSSDNSTKIMFLILDAPPHQSDENIKKLFEKIKWAAKKGITIIPLAASDIDKQTEYLMRTFALLTNGTYTFLTNHSGIGNHHIEPTIDSYEVEKLNSLLLRLILQRATLPVCNNGISNDHLNKKLENEIDRQLDSKITVFPNPTKGLINIKTKQLIDELFVYDLAGKIIIKKEKLMDNKTIDITSYPQSIYLLRIRCGDQWETFKIIKN